MPRKPKPPAAITPPPLPPTPAPSQREIEANERILRQLQQLNVQLEQRCLDNAVLLAQQAAGRRGPLIKHFMEIGRRYQETLNAPQKPVLRVVKGGSLTEEERIEAVVTKHGSIIAAMRAGAI